MQNPSSAALFLRRGELRELVDETVGAAADFGRCHMVPSQGRGDGDARLTVPPGDAGGVMGYRRMLAVEEKPRKGDPGLAMALS